MCVCLYILSLGLIYVIYYSKIQWSNKSLFPPEKKEENGNKSPEKKKKIAAVHFEPDIFAFST